MRKIVMLAALMTAGARIAVAQAIISPPADSYEKDGCTGFGFSVVTAHVTRAVERMAITVVDSGSPASVAGLRVGDSVTAINDVPIGEGKLSQHWRKPPGTPLLLKIRRGGAETQIRLLSGTLGPAPTRADEKRACLSFAPRKEP